MIELRWLVKPDTTTDAHVLEYRQSFAVDASGALCPGKWGAWKRVPLVVDSNLIAEDCAKLCRRHPGQI